MGKGKQHEHHKKPKPNPCYEKDYDDHGRPDHSHHKPPENPRYPDPDLYGSYATKDPPPYVPHSYDHSCFRPIEKCYKPPTKCHEDDGDDNDPQRLCVRRDHRTLTSDQQTRFLNAFAQANALGALGPLVDIHANSTHQMHQHPRFLPWHRIYLLRLEELLQSIDPTVCLPYWKSSEEQAFPSWLLGFTPTVNLASGPHTVTRNIGVFATLPDTADVTAAMGNATFVPFWQDLEGVHDSGHVWVGGSMGIVPTAPCDPIFWMHHAEIDRIWHEWQQTHPTEHPSLTGSAAIMDPWSETEADTRDIAALGYSYA